MWCINCSYTSSSSPHPPNCHPPSPCRACRPFHCPEVHIGEKGRKEKEGKEEKAPSPNRFHPIPKTDPRAPRTKKKTQIMAREKEKRKRKADKHHHRKRNEQMSKYRFTPAITPTLRQEVTKHDGCMEGKRIHNRKEGGTKNTKKPKQANWGFLPSFR